MSTDDVCERAVRFGFTGGRKEDTETVSLISDDEDNFKVDKPSVSQQIPVRIVEVKKEPLDQDQPMILDAAQGAAQGVDQGVDQGADSVPIQAVAVAVALDPDQDLALDPDHDTPADVMRKCSNAVKKMNKLYSTLKKKEVQVNNVLAEKQTVENLLASHDILLADNERLDTMVYNQNKFIDAQDEAIKLYDVRFSEWVSLHAKILFKKRAALLEIDILRAEFDIFRYKSDLTRDSIIAQVAKAERNVLFGIQKMKAVIAERDSLVRERDTLRHEREALHFRLEAIQFEKCVLRAECDQSQQAQQETLTKLTESKSMIETLNEAVQAQGVVVNQHKETIKTQQTIIMEHVTTNQARDASIADLQATIEARDATITELRAALEAQKAQTGSRKSERQAAAKCK
jgi:chromosome segregation ATPase